MNVESQELNAQDLEVQKIFIKKVYEQNFWACLFSGLTKRPNPKCKRLQLVLDEKTLLGIALEYNPGFILYSYKDNPVLLDFALAHEGGHLALRHIPRWINLLRKRIIEFSDMELKAVNIAADLAVNSLCENVIILPGTSQGYWQDQATIREFKEAHLSKDAFPENFDFIPGDTFEGYFQTLLEEIEEKPELCETYEEKSNEHSWIDTDASKTLALNLEHRITSYVKEKTIVFAKNHGIGSLPGGIQQSISLDALNPITKLSIPTLLRSTFRNNSKQSEDAIYSKYNLRLVHLRDGGILPFPAYTLTYGLKIVLIRDTSGSMGDEENKEVTNLAFSFLKTLDSPEFWIVDADTDIHRVFLCKKFEDYPKDILGRGGTDFAKPLKYVEEKMNPDVIIYGTDGHGYAPEKKPRIPLIWCLTSCGVVPASYGTAIRISSEEVLRR